MREHASEWETREKRKDCKERKLRVNTLMVLCAKSLLVYRISGTECEASSNRESRLRV